MFAGQRRLRLYGDDRRMESRVKKLDEGIRLLFQSIDAFSDAFDFFPLCAELRRNNLIYKPKNGITKTGI